MDRHLLDCILFNPAPTSSRYGTHSPNAPGRRSKGKCLYQIAFQQLRIGDYHSLQSQHMNVIKHAFEA